MKAAGLRKRLPLIGVKLLAETWWKDRSQELYWVAGRDFQW